MGVIAKLFSFLKDNILKNLFGVTVLHGKSGQTRSLPYKDCSFFAGSFTGLLALLLTLSCCLGLEDHMKERPECLMWAKLENKTLPLQDQGHANCSTNSDCTGFTCKGIYQVSDQI